MKKYYFTCLFLLISVITSSCARTSGEVWNDTKTCSIYMGKGFCSLFGFTKNNSKTNDNGFVPIYDDLSSGNQSCFSPSIVSNNEMGDEIAFNFKETSLFNNKDICLDCAIYFDTNSYSIKGETNIKNLKNITAYLSKHPKAKIFIEGHTDQRGTASYNLSLGLRRANQIKSFLLENSVKKEQIETISYGKERPVSSDNIELGWKQNRRVEFKRHG